MLTVFIVDDSEVVRNALATVLQTIKGITLTGSVGSISAALAEIPAAKPNVVVLDVFLGDGSGTTVLDQLVRLPAPPVVVMLTAFSRPALRAQCLAAGARYFFDKATEIDAFIATMNDLARNSSTPPAPLAVE